MYVRAWVYIRSICSELCSSQNIRRRSQSKKLINNTQSNVRWIINLWLVNLLCWNLRFTFCELYKLNLILFNIIFRKMINVFLYFCSTSIIRPSSNGSGYRANIHAIICLVVDQYRKNDKRFQYRPSTGMVRLSSTYSTYGANTNNVPF